MHGLIDMHHTLPEDMDDEMEYILLRETKPLFEKLWKRGK